MILGFLSCAGMNNRVLLYGISSLALRASYMKIVGDLIRKRECLGLSDVGLGSGVVAADFAVHTCRYIWHIKHGGFALKADGSAVSFCVCASTYIMM